jgi:hypothetical protein
VVVGGSSKSWKEYREHPQLVFWTGDQKEVQRHVANKGFPANTKILIVSRFISHTESDLVMATGRGLNIPIMFNKTDEEISNLLYTLVGPATAPKTAEEIAVKKSMGRKSPIKFILPQIDWAKSNLDNAKTLMPIIKAAGVTMSEVHVTQFISRQRSKGKGVHAVPKSLRAQLDVTVDMLDGIVKDITGMRDYLIELTEENRMLKSKVEKWKSAFEQLK